MGSLSNLYISQSYQSLIHIGTNNTASATLIGLQDGLGNNIGVSVNTNGDLFLSGSLTASLQQGYLYVGNASGKTTAFATSSLVTNIDTGSLVTTASFNSYTQSTNIRLNNLESTSASVNVSISNLNSTTSSFATSISNLNSNSASVNTSINSLNGATSSYANSASVAAVDAAQQQSINSLNAATSSYVTSAITASSLVTASFSGNTLTFTKGDASTFGVVIPDVSGSTIPAGTVSSSAQIVNYGIFATTGSNQFLGNQAIDGTLTITGKIIGSQSIILQPDANDARTLEIYNTSAADTHITASGGELFLGNDETYVLVNTNANQKLVVIRGDEKIVASGSLDISGSLTSSLQQGYVLVGDSNNRTQLVATSSFGSTIDTGSFATTGSNTFVGVQTINSDLNVSGTIDLGNVNIRDLGGSINFQASGSGPVTAYGITTNPSNGDLVFNTNPGNGRLMTFNQTNGVMNPFNGMKLDTSFIGIDVYDHPLNLSSSYGGMTTMLTTQGNVVISGSLTASLQQGFTYVGNASGITTTVATSSFGGGGTAIINPTLNPYSGSLILVANTFTSSSFAYISASANGQVNLILKSNNATPDTIISGSGNIFTHPTAATAGFKRYLSATNFATILPQITGSAAFSPTLSNNYINTGMLMRIPVSASAYTIGGNIFNNPTANGVNLGTSATLNFEKAVSGLSLSNNNINGTLNAIAYKTPLSASVSITSNNIGGTVALNMDSSSITLTNALVQGTFTVNNSYFPSTFNTNSLLGISTGLYIGTNTIFASGSNTTFTAPKVVGNSAMIGLANVLSASYNGDSTNVTATILLGQSLNVLGTNSRQAGPTGADYGSVFAGRWNDFSGNKGGTAETIFAVGTGTGAATRKTGFLIDSGSNTFIEGTLNVSGSTTMTGSLILSSSAATELTVIGNSQFTGSLTITGSASVNGSQLVKSNQTGSFVTNIFTGGTGNPLYFEYDLGNGGVNTVQLIAPTSLTGSVIITSGSQLTLPTGSNQQAGTAVLDGANPGTVTVSNSLVTANSIIMLTKQTLTNSHMVAITAKSGGSFTITSNGNGDSDTVGWMIINNS
jgi:hypothetical protein